MRLVSECGCRKLATHSIRSIVFEDKNNRIAVPKTTVVEDNSVYDNINP